jgi:hypothetical protein
MRGADWSVVLPRMDGSSEVHSGKTHRSVALFDKVESSEMELIGDGEGMRKDTATKQKGSRNRFQGKE